MKNAAIYARVSTAGQARDGTSLDTQAEACAAYAAAQGYDVRLVIQEEISGARLDEKREAVAAKPGKLASRLDWARQLLPMQEAVRMWKFNKATL